MVNNGDWLRNLNMMDFLRDVGPYFSVNEMLRARCYVNRLANGLSFLEFSYMLMQGYDFYRLYQDYGCNLEFGGDDQWSNMLAGTELIRKKLGKDAQVMTITLLTNKDGKKMGKTAGGAVWLDPEKTSPYEFYQYWRNVDDQEVGKCLRLLTFIPMEEIRKMDSWEGAELNKAKEILAFHLTELVHGTEEAKKAEEAAKALFAGGGASANVPSFSLSKAECKDGIDVLTLLVLSGLAPSKGEARRNVQQGGVSFAGEKVTDIGRIFSQEELSNEPLLQRGKKNFVKIKMNEL